MFEVTIKKEFAAAHRLREIGGQCENLHGHNFTVEVTLAGERLNAEGLLVDFRDLQGWTDEVLATLDHKYLNEIEAFAERNPSAEVLAEYIFRHIDAKSAPQGLPLARVTVWESENARVSYDRRHD